MVYHTTGIARQLRAAVASTSRSVSAVSPARTSLRAVSQNAASSSSSVTLDQLPQSSAPVSATKESIPAAAALTEEQFELPQCLLPTKSLPKTHGVHVGTLHLRSYGDALPNLDLFADFARKAAHSIGIPASGVAHLPTRTSLWTVPRSPFVHKKSQENFWRKTHSRAIKLFDANEQVVDRWLHFLRIHAMPGVGMKAELFRYHEPGVGTKLMDEVAALRRQISSGEQTSATATPASDASASNSESQSAEQSAQSVKKIADGIVEKEMAKEQTQ
ncbi:ribosomal protein S10 [Testicularia cyperi]|uniref:Small ribosomal subunit protein uS10m n=1 Tax=Testicularia cyperi TaxID=1882483 RepID=A0A317XV17_9BASI|nr:ribosomal protein S10 [Testicularia cyperi]